jgi:D-glycero-D-manno-heptose 1,7-bisphosphate phosphatase
MINGTSEVAVPVLYLDLDGTVRHGKDELCRFVNTPDDVVIFPESMVLMRKWKEAGGRIAGVSNQGGIALGHFTMDDCRATMHRTHQLAEGLFDTIAWCRHHPSASDPFMARCWCRKPSPGLIIEAAHYMSQRFPGEIYPPALALMVGDRPEDEQCARTASIDFISAAEWRAKAT